MSLSFPSIQDFIHFSWDQIQPYFDALESQELSPDTVESWLSEWSRLRELLHERAARVRVATVLDTTDPEAETAYDAFLQEIYPHMQAGNNALTQKLLGSGLQVPGMGLPMRKMQVEAELYREENLPLQSQELTISKSFNKVIGAQTVEWEGEEYTITQISPRYQKANRADRQRIWERVENREATDRDAINGLWVEVLDLRLQQAANAGYVGDYRAYRWQYLKRLDYTPADCRVFHDAIEEVAVPVAAAIYEKHRRRMGVESIRPWDLDLYQQTFPIQARDLQPYSEESELEERGSAIFHQVDPVLGTYFDTLRREGFMDLPNRKGKGPGAFCTTYEASRRPFIFMNGVGQASDVNTLLHESGHAFHGFETFNLPYYHQRWPSMEFAEVASTAMELLASPYLTRDVGGFYNTQDAALAPGPASRKAAALLAVYGGGGRFPALGIRAPGGSRGSRSVRRGLVGGVGPVYPRDRLGWARARQIPRLAPQTPYPPFTVLLYRVWAGPAGGGADLGQGPAGPGGCSRGLPPGACAGWNGFDP